MNAGIIDFGDYCDRNLGESYVLLSRFRKAEDFMCINYNSDRFLKPSNDLLNKYINYCNWYS